MRIQVAAVDWWLGEAAGPQRDSGVSSRAPSPDSAEGQEDPNGTMTTMLARRHLPAEFLAWNKEWGAPFGFENVKHSLMAGHRFSKRAVEAGMFAFQENNTTRTFEYPWAWFATELRPGMQAADIGGGMAGFQFALSRKGLRVINVDPGADGERTWGLSGDAHASLNRAFKTDVELRRCSLSEADIASGSLDRVFSISTLEHLDRDERRRTMQGIGRVLRPGGLAVLTIDLFLDVTPFADEPSNPWGENVDVREMVRWSELELVVGDPAELHGYSEFDHRLIRDQTDDYFVGNYPCLVQMVVLRKP